MYPQTVVPSGDDLHTTLTNGSLGLNEDVKATGDYYTANVNGSAWSSGNQELNPVYEHDNKCYVRVTPWAFLGYSSINKYNNGETIGQTVSTNTNYRWFKVEPIKWIILNTKGLVDKEAIYNEELGIMTDLPVFNQSVYNTTLELYAADVLVSGIQFNSESSTQSVWDQSSIYKYLNIDFYNQSFSDIEKTKIKISKTFNNNGDGTQHNNAAYGLNSNHSQSGGMNHTNQKIYMLSYYEMFNAKSPYVMNGIFKTVSPITAKQRRQVPGTDYARAHNLYLSGNGFTYYWMRTAHSSPDVYYIYADGGFGTHYVNFSYTGTRPALTMVCFAL